MATRASFGPWGAHSGSGRTTQPSTVIMPSEDTKERIAKVVDVSRTILHYGWIPLIIYVGFTRSNPQPSLIKLISPLA
ncbi:Tom7-domain-containing protein [Marasmius fiardii PR-910]|nr:Tom7-domain-containing protein [Marasmius fiardii PR-910]